MPQFLRADIFRSRSILLSQEQQQFQWGSFKREEYKTFSRQSPNGFEEILRKRDQRLRFLRLRKLANGVPRGSNKAAQIFARILPKILDDLLRITKDKNEESRE